MCLACNGSGLRGSGRVLDRGCLTAPLQVMQLAGIEGQQVVLLLEDYQFVHPAFLEMVNSLLSSGQCVSPP